MSKTGAVPWLDTAIAALAAGEVEEAELLLKGGLGSPLPQSLQARTHSLLAQALEAQGRSQEARKQASLALALAKELGDEAGQADIRGLQARIRASLVAEEHRVQKMAQVEKLSKTPLKTLLAEAANPADRVSALVSKADAERWAGRAEKASQLAQQALEEAQALEGTFPRERVLAHLCLARARPQDAATLLAQAHGIADSAQEPQLVTAIAQTARLLLLPLPTHTF